MIKQQVVRRYAGTKWLNNYCKSAMFRTVSHVTQLDSNSNIISNTTTTSTVDAPDLIKTQISSEPTLYEYITHRDAVVEEYIQKSILKDDESIILYFVALRFKETQEELRNSIFSEDEINDVLKANK